LRAAAKCLSKIAQMGLTSYRIEVRVTLWVGSYHLFIPISILFLLKISALQ